MNLDPAKFPPHEIASPCGLLAKFFPTDTFEELIELQQTKQDNGKNGLSNIASENKFPVNKKIIEDKFYKVAFSPDSSGKQWIDVTNPLFINWMEG